MFTDTDSLCFHVETEDFYKDMQEHKQIYDFSGYNINHFLYDDSNKKKLGCMKDETNGLPIKEFTGLRSKCYSLIVENFDNFNECYYKIHGIPLPKPEKEEETNKMRNKGIQKSVINKELNQNKYNMCLDGQDPIQYNNVRMFKSVNHQIYTVKQNKVSLSQYDNKRYIMDDGITTLPYGHCKIKNIK